MWQLPVTSFIKRCSFGLARARRSRTPAAIDLAANTSASLVADATNTVKMDKTLPTAPTVTGGEKAIRA